MWKNNRWVSVWRKKSIFWKTFWMVSLISVVSMLIFGIFVNQLMLNSQRSRIHELSLTQLRQTSQDVEMRLDVLEENMEQVLWSNDFVSLMVNPLSRNSDSNYRVLSSLNSYVEGNRLIKKAWLYVPALDEVYSSTGNYIVLDSSSEKMSIQSYLNTYAEHRESNDNTNCIIFHFGDRLLQVVDFCVPNFIGALFFEIDLDMLNQIVQANMSETVNDANRVYIFDEEGKALYSNKADTNTEEILLDQPELFLTDGNDNSDASWYLHQSEILGWSFVRSAKDAGGMAFGWDSIMGLMIPFLLIYFLISQMYSMYISRSIYRPINRLMQIADRGYHSEKHAVNSEEVHNEMDYLELVYTDALDENTQYRQLMNSISHDIMEQLFRSLLSGKSLSEEYIRGTLEGTGNSTLVSGLYVAIAMTLEMPEDRKPTIVETGLYQRSMISLISQHPEEFCQRFPFYMEKEVLVVVCCYDGDVSALGVKQDLKAFVEMICDKTQDLPYRILLGRGKVYNDIHSLRYSYQEALAEVRYQQYMDDESEEMASDGFDRKYYEERARQVVEMAEKGSREEAEAMAQVLISELGQSEEAKRQDYCEMIVDAMLEKLISGRVSSAELKELGLSHSSEELGQVIKNGEMDRYMMNFCSNAIRAIQSGSKKNRFKYVNDAKEYLEAHYFDGNLSLNSVSEAIGISAPYLSGVFNEVMKENFNSYLNSYRVKQAKQFLEETSQSVAEIGYKCGFNSAQSFSRVFKKHTGFTPGQYREKKRGGV